MILSIMISIGSLFCSIALVLVNIVYSKSNKNVDYSRSFLHFILNPEYAKLIDDIEANEVFNGDWEAQKMFVSENIEVVNAMLYELEILLDLFKKSKKINKTLDIAVFKHISKNDYFCGIIDNMFDEHMFKKIKRKIRKNKAEA